MSCCASPYPPPKLLRALSVPRNQAVPQHGEVYRWCACGRTASCQVAQMCGIAGLYCFNPACTDDHAALVSGMCALQHHRGPDDRGTESLGCVAIGSNRLSIIDLRPAGHMPMSDPETGAWIVFNGEIYNFAEIREALVALGHSFLSLTDTEVVLHAWLQWGEACLQRFTGMYAFGIHDPRDESLVLVRDRFGKKPLYYSRTDAHLLFASELKSLVAIIHTPRIDWPRVMEWSMYRNVDFGSSDTLFAGLLSLPAGHLMEIRQGMVSPPKPYYSLESRVSAGTCARLNGLAPAALHHEIETLLMSAVEDRLVSDVPIGTFCSGGIDSSLITALAARKRKDLLAFNVSVAGRGAQDESRFARQVTDSLGVRLLTLTADGKSFRDNLVRAIYFNDYPLTHANSVFFLLVAEFARSHGTKVLLSGEAADELFGGYTHRYRRYGLYLRLQKFLRYVPEKLRRLLVTIGDATHSVQQAEYVGYDERLAHTTSYIDKFSRIELRERCSNAYAFIDDEVDRGMLGAMLADIGDFLAPLLRRLDRMSMAASVECRVPFLDHRLVDTVVNLPLALRVRGSEEKWLLKRIAAQYLPHRIVHRKKLGFILPLHDYLEPIANTMIFNEGFCVEALRLNRRGMDRLVSCWTENVYGFFALLSLEIWGRMYIRGESVAAVEQRLRECSA